MVYQCEKRSKQNIICDRFNHIAAFLLLTSYLLPLTSYFLPLTSYFLPLTSYLQTDKFTIATNLLETTKKCNLGKNRLMFSA